MTFVYCLLYYLLDCFVLKADFEAAAKERDSAKEVLVELRQEKRNIEKRLEAVMQSMQGKQEELDVSEVQLLAVHQPLQSFSSFLAHSFPCLLCRMLRWACSKRLQAWRYTYSMP